MSRPTFDGDYIAVGAEDTVYMFALSKYLEYIVREQVKIAKLMKAMRSAAAVRKATADISRASAARITSAE